ncbi:Uncharacterised protein [Vibrio cholerae]|nr:Uncharacterised protein [Vibrio cholerae]
MGIIKVKATTPTSRIWFHILPAGMAIPASVGSPPTARASAIKSPPVTTNGIMCETPFIKKRYKSERACEALFATD